ncbi:MAG: hypothetical protein ABIH77_06250 [Pseudomonadota bacterium]
MRKRIENYLNFSRLKSKYRVASREKRIRILNEVCDLTGMHRKSLVRMLNRKIKRIKPHRGLAPKYQYDEILPVIKIIWFACDQMGSKRLHAAIPLWLPFYEQEHGPLTDFTRLQLLSISPATMDRLLKKTKVKYSSKRMCGTKPGTLLKNQIPIRLHHWDEHENDNAHVEQKNWTHVRQLLGYDRFDHPALVKLINDLYCHEWRLYQNHFMPTLKCIKKEKINSKYRKQYDTPKTPYERVLSCETIEEEVKQQLTKEHQELNPFQLKRQIEKKLSCIFKYVKVSTKVRRRI